MSGKRILIIILLLLIGGGIVVWLLLSPPVPKRVSALSQARGISLFGYDKQGKISWAVRAKTGQVEKGKKSTLSDVSLSFLSDKKIEAEARCDTLSYSGDKATLSGNVTLREEGGIRLVTDEADWNTTTREISASDVTITVQSGSITAPNFLYQTDDRRAIMSGGVKASLTGASPLTVDGDKATAHADTVSINGDVRVHVRDEIYTADRLEYSSKNGVTTLSGGVVGIFSHGKITAGKIVIGEHEISASGGVHISLNNGFFGGS